MNGTMKMVTRRQLVKQGALVATGVAFAGGRSLLANPMGQPIGFQTYEIIKHLSEDWQGTWNKMASFGYKVADLVQFGQFGGAQLKDKTAKDILGALTAAGLICTNGHFSYNAWTQNYAESVQYSHDLGLKSVICALGPMRKTADDFKWMSDQLNDLGKKLAADGLKLGYHNHEIEFVAVEGQIPWDILLTHTDPRLVHYQIDVGNLTFGGGNALEYLAKYPGRYYSLHCKDFVKGQASVPVGQGTLDWKKIFATAKQQDIKSYVAEVGAYGVSSLDGAKLEQSKLDVLDSFRQSAAFLKSIKN
jgi:sugar phosphate isomerase/epimerase